jgi:hypothetical protein
VLVTVLAGCSGAQNVRPLRTAVTESSGDYVLSLEEPVRAVACVVRDFRRSPSDPGAARPIWTARCIDGPSCRTAVRYGDRTFQATRQAEPLHPSEQGTCYECELIGDHGRGLTRFRVGDRGDFEVCRPRVGDL